MRQRVSLILNNGERFEGELIGAPLRTSGELVFTTGMVGYSEALTDPSYFGQILIFTYPLIGNYGIPEAPRELQLPIPRGFESNRVSVSAVIMTVDSVDAYHWSSFQSIDRWLEREGVVGIAGLDTRHLVHKVRQTRRLLGRIEPESPKGVRSLSPRLTSFFEGDRWFDPGEHDVLTEVSCTERKRLGKGSVRIGVVDCGVKWNILRQLLEADCEVELVPWSTDLRQVDVSAWLLSNGPGDPKRTGDLRARVAGLLKEDRPVLGICLGNQILALAAGADTRRMPYGHRSHNQPVHLLGTRRGFITSQNHGYEVDAKTLPEDWEVWFENANDRSVEGIKHRTKPFRGVQFHPEAAGGPRDTGWILREFVEEVTG